MHDLPFIHVMRGALGHYINFRPGAYGIAAAVLKITYRVSVIYYKNTKLIFGAAQAVSPIFSLVFLVKAAYLFSMTIQ
ncbi:hypothetical protein VV869_17130 [Photobacterium sp. MCCC 1A19761]|uniref:hypothetical protein n=1 Tax=Photobacterium sp. MCCC 1A19761 TaxID=3115000 RepID=UPI00307E51E3